MKTENKEKLLDLYYRIAGLHIDLEEMRDLFCSDPSRNSYDNAMAFISGAADEMEEFCKSKGVSVE